MISTTIPAFVLSTIIAINSINPVPQSSPQVLSDHIIKLDQRVEGGGSMSDIMADNILLTLAYLNNEKIDPGNPDWQELRKNKIVKFVIDPGKTFAFHQDVLNEFENKTQITTNAHFGHDQGFKSDGYLIGDGVCHLASLLNWVAKDANLEVIVPTNHDFMSIPEIDKKYGTSIYYYPGNKDNNSKQNLYITNNFDKQIEFDLIVEDKNLEAKVITTN